MFIGCLLFPDATYRGSPAICKFIQRNQQKWIDNGGSVFHGEVHGGVIGPIVPFVAILDIETDIGIPSFIVEALNDLVAVAITKGGKQEVRRWVMMRAGNIRIGPFHEPAVVTGLVNALIRVVGAGD